MKPRIKYTGTRAAIYEDEWTAEQLRDLLFFLTANDYLVFKREPENPFIRPWMQAPNV